MIVIKVDEWILRRYQAVSDWVYTEFDLSPYLISAQCFGAVSAIGIAYLGYKSTVLQTADFVDILLAITTLMFSVLWVPLAIRKHKQWLRTKLPEAPNFIDLVMRFGFLLMAASFTLTATIESWAGENHDLTHWLLAMREITASSAFYFYACRPPSFTQRRDSRLIPEAG